MEDTIYIEYSFLYEDWEDYQTREWEYDWKKIEENK